MNRARFTTACLLVAAGAAAIAQAPPSTTTGAHTFTQIAPGIYSAVGTAGSNAGSNSAVIVNQDDVLVVDAHMTPEAGRALLRDIKTITDKPVRFVVDTHFHYDHTDGNQVFAPIADIIGHEYTRKRLAGDILQHGMFAELLNTLPKQIDDLAKRAAAEQDATAKARLEAQLAGQRAFNQQVRETKPTPPNVTLSDHMTLFRGDREIRLLYLGHGHTGGDVVVYLPKERVLCSGDLLVNQIANMVDGYVNEWPAALEKLKPLDFVDVIPGHGEPFKGKERIDWFQAYLRDLWTQATKLHADGVPAADAAKRADMTAHKAHYAGITGPGVPAVAMTRIYAVMEGKAN
ncbi:MAG TPA: MBL fold metallo-hydrolase [Vicinamibacterales bacterium]|jgi:glyoxylase-like metal-dependent hydrolase (beta-lactamase superfamily II)